MDGWQFLNRFRSAEERRGLYERGIKIRTCQSAARSHSLLIVACAFHDKFEPYYLVSCYLPPCKPLICQSEPGSKLQKVAEHTPENVCISYLKSTLLPSLVPSETHHVCTVCVVEAVSYFPPSLPHSPSDTCAVPFHSAHSLCGRYPLAPR